MILVTFSPKDFKEFKGLEISYREPGSYLVVSCSEAALGIDDTAISVLSGGYVRAEVDLGDDNPLNLQVKLLAKGQGDYELLVMPLQEAQGGWASH